MEIKALVNPKILIWAREINGLQIESVAKRINKESQELIEWESGESKPTVEDARNLAEIYNQCLAVFYLQSPPKNFNVRRILRWYEKDGDALVGEQILNIDLRWLQKLFGESRDSLMFECYPVSKIQAKRLGKKMKCLLNLNSFDYFLESFAD